jgi:hypothetical protein
MNRYLINFFLPIIYFCIGLWCLAMAKRGYKSHKLIFKRGIKGTGLENNEFLIWTQIIATFILGLSMIAYSLIYLILILQKFTN